MCAYIPEELGFCVFAPRLVMLPGCSRAGCMGNCADRGERAIGRACEQQRGRVFAYRVPVRLCGTCTDSAYCMLMVLWSLVRTYGSQQKGP